MRLSSERAAGLANGRILMLNTRHLGDLVNAGADFSQSPEPLQILRHEFVHVMQSIINPARRFRYYVITPNRLPTTYDELLSLIYEFETDRLANIGLQKEFYVYEDLNPRFRDLYKDLIARIEQRTGAVVTQRHFSELALTGNDTILSERLTLYRNSRDGSYPAREMFKQFMDQLRIDYSRTVFAR